MSISERPLRLHTRDGPLRARRVRSPGGRLHRSPHRKQAMTLVFIVLSILAFVHAFDLRPIVLRALLSQHGSAERGHTLSQSAPPAASPAGLAAPRSPEAPESTVLVTGATGFVGSALVQRLQGEGWRVLVLSRDRMKARALFGAGVQVVERLDELRAETRIDAIVHLAGARVLGLPWTARRRRELLASRIDLTRAVIDLVARLHRRPSVMVCASAVGFYGASPRASFDARVETSPPRPGEFQSDLCQAIEHEACRAEAFGLRVVRLRLGVVFGRGGGAYPMLALSARLGLGAVLGSGRQAAPWIHLEDAVGLIRFAIDNDRCDGPVNAVAPDTPTQARFAAALAASFGRRVRLRMPDALLRLAAGEMSTLLLDGQNAVPAAALEAGYVFRHPALEEALADLAGRPGAVRR
ncbi:MAG: TIGR01777 family protein [Comamonadaceae bacterium]|nr:MAG: TIGR01777 family protein [Comamonadaceae bacterium]